MTVEDPLQHQCKSGSFLHGCKSVVLQCVHACVENIGVLILEARCVCVVAWSVHMDAV